MSQPVPPTRLLWPSSIAFIGGTEAEIALVKTRALGFAGRLYAVNPRRSSLGGVDCHASITARSWYEDGRANTNRNSSSSADLDRGEGDP